MIKQELKEHLESMRNVVSLLNLNGNIDSAAKGNLTLAFNEALELLEKIGDTKTVNISNLVGSMVVMPPLPEMTEELRKEITDMLVKAASEPVVWHNSELPQAVLPLAEYDKLKQAEVELEVERSIAKNREEFLSRVKGALTEIMKRGRIDAHDIMERHGLEYKPSYTTNDSGEVKNIQR